MFEQYDCKACEPAASERGAERSGFDLQEVFEANGAASLSNGAPMERAGYERDSVHGGPGGYYADRERYRGGSSYNYRPHYDYGYDYGYGGGGRFFRPPVLIPPAPPVLIPPRPPMLYGGGDCYSGGGYRGGCGGGYDYRYDYVYPMPQPYWDGGYYSRDNVYGGPDGYYSDRYRYGGGGGYSYGRGPSYDRDHVYGGPDGYYADRERYRGGSYGYGGGGYRDGWDTFGQVFDFALRGFDTWGGYDIARRHARGQYR